MTEPAKPTAGDDYPGLPTIWYERDNYTSRQLPNDVEQALIAMREEWDNGNIGGRLRSNNRVHAHCNDSWDEFEVEARDWLRRQLEMRKKD